MTEIIVGDITMYYEQLGSGDPVLFLHGLGSSSMGWQLQQDVFAQKYSVLLADMRGHGRSSHPPGPYSVSQFGADVIGLLDELDIVKPVHLVGLSMGGMISFQMAVDYPERVRSMTIVNSGPELISDGFRNKLLMWQRKMLINFLSLEKIGNAVAGRLFPEPEQEKFRDLFVKDLLQNDKKSYKAATKALFGWSVRDRIGQIACPVLVISADQDYTPVAAKEAYVAEMLHAKLLVIENSHHATPIDQASLFNTAVLQFLAETA